MQIAIKKAETLDNKPLVSIWFGDRQVVLKEYEFEELKGSIDLFVNAGIKIIGFSTHFKPSDNHNEYLDIHTKVQGKEQHEIFVLKHRKERQEYLDYIKQHGMISEEEYKRCLPTE